MRYFLSRDTLFLRGGFNAASTGLRGGMKQVSTILNHTVPEQFSDPDPETFLDRIIAREGYGPDYFGLLTAVEMRNLCILHYDYIAVFITAGVRAAGGKDTHTVNTIVWSSQALTPGAMLETIITVSGAKADALRAAGYDCTGTPTDAVVVACEGEEIHRFAGPVSEAGRRIFEAVRFGVAEALKRHEGKVQRSNPSMFVFSRYGGEHWTEWIPEGCPFYPCHFPGQRCDLCYCPFYPCGDPNLGEYVESSAGGQVWSCSRCTLVHQPEVTEYYKRNPEASLDELKRVWRRTGKRSGTGTKKKAKEK